MLDVDWLFSSHNERCNVAKSLEVANLFEYGLQLAYMRIFWEASIYHVSSERTKQRQLFNN